MTATRQKHTKNAKRRSGYRVKDILPTLTKDSSNTSPSLQNEQPDLATTSSHEQRQEGLQPLTKIVSTTSPEIENKTQSKSTQEDNVLRTIQAGKPARKVHINMPDLTYLPLLELDLPDPLIDLVNLDLAADTTDENGELDDDNDKVQEIDVTVKINSEFLPLLPLAPNHKAKTGTIALS